MKPTEHRAVMASRREPPDSLDFFPTPPWATRALLEHVIPRACGTVWEPAAGEGHMAQVIAEYGQRFPRVVATDVHDYGGLDGLGSFVGQGLDVIANPAGEADWIITNPPFNLACEFAERAIVEARLGVALLVRTSWLEGVDRYQRLFSRYRPDWVAQFVERVPMVNGRWNPAASTATSYCWVVWRGGFYDHTRFVWIPPGCRQRLTRPDDVARFAGCDAGH